MMTMMNQSGPVEDKNFFSVFTVGMQRSAVFAPFNNIQQYEKTRYIASICVRGTFMVYEHIMY